MPKRARDAEDDCGPLSKKNRCENSDRLSSLSDEIVLKVLSCLSISELTLCQRLSRRFNVLAGDSELWKEKYYSAWVRPRARRIPGLKDRVLASGALKYSSKLSRWLEDGRLVERGKETNWKRQYRLRQNWSRGSCRVNNLEVAHPPIPPVVVKFHRGIVFTVDSGNGLRAWSVKDQQVVLASTPIRPSNSIQRLPSSLGVDTAHTSSDDINVIIGFDDGSFCVHTLHISTQSFEYRYSHPSSSNGSITAVASASPYLLTLSQNKLLSLYRFPISARKDVSTLHPPQLLASLLSNAIWSPLSLSIRISSSGLVACVAYSFSRIGVGWSVGLQELRLTEEGESVGSRLASTEESAMDPLTAAQFWNPRHRSLRQAVQARSAAASHSSTSLQPNAAAPTSLSYSHPYLLASHPDNTLTIYLVVSDADGLSIKPGRRLWGHTSSVASAQVSDRGKAVSISAAGNEIRIWELEDIITSSAQRRADNSVQVSPAKSHAQPDQDLGIVSEAIERRGDGLGLALRDRPSEMFLARGWVGFDDEQVVVLREKHVGTQILSCYDFT